MNVHICVRFEQGCIKETQIHLVVGGAEHVIFLHLVVAIVGQHVRLIMKTMFSIKSRQKLVQLSADGGRPFIYHQDHHRVIVMSQWVSHIVSSSLIGKDIFLNLTLILEPRHTESQRVPSERRWISNPNKKRVPRFNITEEFPALGVNTS